MTRVEIVILTLDRNEKVLLQYDSMKSAYSGLLKAVGYQPAIVSYIVGIDALGPNNLIKKNVESQTGSSYFGVKEIYSNQSLKTKTYPFNSFACIKNCLTAKKDIFYFFSG